MALRQKRTRRAKNKTIIDAGIAGIKIFFSMIGLLGMGLVTCITAISAYTFRFFGLMVKKIQNMRSPPIATTVPTSNATSTKKTARQSIVNRVPSSNTTSRAGQWVAQGKSIVVHGITITNGLLYAGETLRTANGTDDPCLINSAYPIAFRSAPATLTGYWPSYATLSPQARRTYLEWLAGGCKDPNTDIGYVFLYFYGIERRAVFDAALDSNIMRDYPVLAIELTRLLSIYANRSKSFKRYAQQLLDWVTFTNEKTMYGNNNVNSVVDSLMKIKFAIGQAVVESAPISAKLILAWVKEDRSNFALRTPAVRCSAQFYSVFETRYRETFGAGMVIPSNKTRLKFIYAPASSGFSAGADIAMSFKDIPDISVVAKTTTAICTIIEEATQIIEPFSRYLSRNPQGNNDLDGLILLPSYLWPTALRQTLHGLKRDVLKSTVFMTFLELMNVLGASTTLNKDKCKALAQALAALSIGMEPDILMTQKAPRSDELIVLFDLPSTPDPTRDSPEYKACFITVQLAAAVAASDGEFSKHEFLHLDTQLQQWSHVPMNHRKRLAAQLRIRRLNPIKLHVLTKQMEALSNEEKVAIMASLETLVQSGNNITATEVHFVGKVYQALGMENTHYLNEHRAILMRKTPPTNSTKTALPVNVEHVSVRKTLYLDPGKIAALHEETATVSALLEQIFTPESREQLAIDSLPAIAAAQTLTTLVGEVPVQLNFTCTEALQRDTNLVEHLLDDTVVKKDTINDVAITILTNSNADSKPADLEPDIAHSVGVVAPYLPGLNTTHDAFARFLLSRRQWSRKELQEIATNFNVMLDGALECLNDAAFNTYDMPFTEGDDPIDINMEIKEKLCS